MAADMSAASVAGTADGHIRYEDMPDAAAPGAAHVTPDPKRSRSNETMTSASSGRAFSLHPPVSASYGPAPHHRNPTTSPGNMISAIQDMLDSQTGRLTKHFDDKFAFLTERLDKHDEDIAEIRLQNKKQDEELVEIRAEMNNLKLSAMRSTSAPISNREVNRHREAFL
eukprot:1598100-Karenia_brevis.AAC.1